MSKHIITELIAERARSTSAIDPATISGRVYIASPLATYKTPRYDTAVRSIQRAMPDARLLPARDQFRSNHHWRRTWRSVLRLTDGLVFFTDTDNTIGAGVARELRDAWDSGIPVFFLPHAEKSLLLPCPEDGGDTVEFYHCDHPTMSKRYSVYEYGAGPGWTLHTFGDHRKMFEPDSGDKGGL